MAALATEFPVIYATMPIWPAAYSQRLERQLSIVLCVEVAENP